MAASGSSFNYLQIYRIIFQMSNEHLYRINVWFYSCFLKLIPCIVLTLVTALLVRAMIQVILVDNFQKEDELQILGNSRL